MMILIAVALSQLAVMECDRHQWGLDRCERFLLRILVGLSTVVWGEMA